MEKWRGTDRERVIKPISFPISLVSFLPFFKSYIQRKKVDRWKGNDGVPVTKKDSATAQPRERKDRGNIILAFTSPLLFSFL